MDCLLNKYINDSLIELNKENNGEFKVSELDKNIITFCLDPNTGKDVERLAPALTTYKYYGWRKNKNDLNPNDIINTYHKFKKNHNIYQSYSWFDVLNGLNRAIGQINNNNQAVKVFKRLKYTLGNLAITGVNPGGNSNNDVFTYKIKQIKDSDSISFKLARKYITKYYSKNSSNNNNLQIIFNNYVKKEHFQDYINIKDDKNIQEANEELFVFFNKLIVKRSIRIVNDIQKQNKIKMYEELCGLVNTS